MGTEKYVTTAIRTQVNGQPGKWIDPASVPHKTPNHWALILANNYGADPARGAQPLINFIEHQLSTGFMTNAGADEALSTSHIAWWLNAKAFALWAANEAWQRPNRAQVTAATTRWWRALLALWDLLTDPYDEQICTPSARSHAIHGAADQRQQFDDTAKYLSGGRVRWNANREGSLDWTGLWILRKLGPMSVKRSTADLPVLRNKLTVEHAAIRGQLCGHRAWFDTTAGMLDAAWSARCDYGNGAQVYSTQRGEPAPFDGAGVRTVQTELGPGKPTDL